MSTAIVLAGLGFGDEGKGTTTEFLANHFNAKLVVRYNGGAQAAHNIVTNDGRHHTFSQFGSASFLGAKTYLSKYMLVEPIALMNEGYALEEKGLNGIFDNIFVNEGCPIITPYHRAVNRIKEWLRGNGAHGSTGRGIGETMSDWLKEPDFVPLVRDILSPKILLGKLNYIKKMKLCDAIEMEADKKHLPDRIKKELFVLQNANPEEIIRKYGEFKHRVAIVSNNYLDDYLTNESNTAIFEGSQGVLLDQDWGFQPHTTWSNITFENADNLLSDHNVDVKYVGVTRTYHTRHGNGPFPTEIKEKILWMDRHNVNHPYAGSFRAGRLDLVLMDYAIKVLGKLDFISLTHLDLQRIWEVCSSWNEGDIRGFIKNEKLIKAPNDEHLYDHQKHVTLILNTLTREGFEIKEYTREGLIDLIENLFGVPVKIESWGPALKHKVWS